LEDELAAGLREEEDLGRQEQVLQLKLAEFKRESDEI